MKPPLRHPRSPFARAWADALTRAIQLGGSGFALPYKPDELYRVPTDDGSAIGLGRYHPRARRRFEEPVVLCHGLGANRFDLDFDERYSLARYLARRGYETWVVELRGRGLAGPPGNATFDDEVSHDVTAVLRAVLAAGHRAVTWVGHSKGGILLYAHLARYPQAPIRAAVTLGSPVAFNVQLGLKKFVRAIGPLLKLDVLPVSRLTALAAFGPPPGPMTRYLVLEENVAPEIASRALANVPSNIAGGVARQMAGWVTRSSFDSVDGSFSYKDGMKAIRIPVLLIAGSRDLLAPPMSVGRAKDWMSGPVKLVVAGRAHGFEEDYGHSDLSVGRKAPDEIFPVVEQFLAAHSTPVGMPVPTANAG